MSCTSGSKPTCCDRRTGQGGSNHRGDSICRVQVSWRAERCHGRVVERGRLIIRSGTQSRGCQWSIWLALPACAPSELRRGTSLRRRAELAERADDRGKHGEARFRIVSRDQRRFQPRKIQNSREGVRPVTMSPATRGPRTHRPLSCHAGVTPFARNLLALRVDPGAGSTLATSSIRCRGGACNGFVERAAR